MLKNMLFTLLYLCAAATLAFMAWSHYTRFPAPALWVAAGICGIVGLWRLLHLSKGS